jgi:hypothetical protein
VVVDTTARLELRATNARLSLFTTVDRDVPGLEQAGTSSQTIRASFEGFVSASGPERHIRLSRTSLLGTTPTSPTLVVLQAPPRTVDLRCDQRRIDAHAAESGDHESVGVSTALLTGLPAVTCSTSDDWLDGVSLSRWHAGRVVFGENSGFDYRVGTVGKHG